MRVPRDGGGGCGGCVESAMRRAHRRAATSFGAPVRSGCARRGCVVGVRSAPTAAMLVVRTPWLCTPQPRGGAWTHYAGRLSPSRQTALARPAWWGWMGGVILIQFLAGFDYAQMSAEQDIRKVFFPICSVCMFTGCCSVSGHVDKFLILHGTFLYSTGTSLL